MLMWIPLVLLLPAAVVSTRYVVDMVAERQEHMAAEPGKYDWTYPAFSDLSVTLIALLVLLVTMLNYRVNYQLDVNSDVNSDVTGAQ